MTAEQFGSLMASIGRFLAPEQRMLAVRSVAAMVDHEAEQRADADCDRREMERQFEENQLSEAGHDEALARRRREPA